MGRHTHSVSESPQRPTSPMGRPGSATTAPRQSRALPWRLAQPLLPLIVPVMLLLVAIASPITSATALAAPLSGQGPGVTVSPNTGPAGTHIIVSGTNFNPGDHVTVGYTTGTCSPSVTTITGANGTVDGNGGVVINTTWPSVPNGTYTICVIDGSKAYPSNPFTSTSQNAPAITVSPNPVASSQQERCKAPTSCWAMSTPFRFSMGHRGRMAAPPAPGRPPSIAMARLPLPSMRHLSHRTPIWW